MAIILKQRDKDIMKFIEKYEGITIQQCGKMFFKNSKFPYDSARLRLKKLYNHKYLKRYEFSKNGFLVYCINKSRRLSLHKIYLLNFYAEMINQGCKILSFDTEVEYMNCKIRPDGVVMYEFNNEIFPLIIEIDLTNMTSIKKYEALYKTGELQKTYGNDVFPLICIIGYNGDRKSNSFLNVSYLDFDLNDFNKKVLMA